MRRLRVLRWGDWSVPLALLGAAVLCYGIFFKRLGFYWDDFPFAWMSTVYGSEGLARYFSTNRPFWGWIYQFTTPILGNIPWRWQLFGLFWRWLAALGWWLVLRRVFPGRQKLAAAAALCFLVYPGFGQQSTALMYGHFFIIYSALIFSFYLSLHSLPLPLRHPDEGQGRAGASSSLPSQGRAGERFQRSRLLFTLPALLLSAVNLLCMEYFFPLEALRPVLFWAAMPEKRGWARIKAAFKAWLPYLAVLLAVAAWRAFFFSYQTQNYDLSLGAQLKTAPLATLLGLAAEVLRSLWLTGAAAWLKTLLPDPAALNTRTSLLLFAAVTAASYLAFALYFARLRENSPGASKAARGLPVLVGLAGLLLAGWPFWVTNLPVRLHFPNDRFSLPFMLGASLLAAGALDWIGNLRMRRRAYPLGTALLAAALALAIGAQVQNATLYRRDWAQQKAFFWQLRWRVPGLQPGTLLFTNDLPLRYYSDNSLTAPLNWIYAGENPSAEVPYALYYPSVRLGKSLPALQPGLPVLQDYLVAPFHGSTSQAVTLYYNPPSCLRLIDPQIEKHYLGLPALMREASALSDPHWIDPQGDAQLPAWLYNPEPAHGWCYYFEQADLARQQGDWAQVAALGDAAFALDDFPNDPMERLVFIEGYAHTGGWQRALELSAESQRVTPLMQEPLCALWARIARNTPASAEKEAALAAVEADLGCR